MTSLADWYPLESSPEVLTALARQWGLPPTLSFVDVLGLDAEVLALVPRPVHAIVLLFPDTEEMLAARAHAGPILPVGVGEDVLWIPQVHVGHSCGTYAVVHALAETRQAPGLASFLDACRSVDTPSRTHLLATSPTIKDAHNAVVQAGQTRLRDADLVTSDHFISFVEHNGRVVELDGSPPRAGPVDWGVCRDLLGDVARIVREEYLPHGADMENHFSMLALVGEP